MTNFPSSESDEPLHEFAAETSQDDWSKSLDSRRGAKVADKVGNTIHRITNIKFRWIAGAAFVGTIAYFEFFDSAPQQPVTPSGTTYQHHDICVQNLPPGLAQQNPTAAMNLVAVCHDRQLIPGADGTSS